jgi:hypothetical protein
MPHRPTSEIPARVLAAETGEKPPQGRTKQAGATKFWVGSPNGLAMSIKIPGSSRVAALILPGATGENSDRQILSERLG